MATLIIPDIVIVNTLNAILTMLRNNHNDAIDDGDESRSLLYILFNALNLGTYDYYENVKQLIITTSQDPKHLNVQLAFPHNTGDSTVSMYVSLASDSNKNDSLNMGQGNQSELVLSNDNGEDEYIPLYNRRFATTYQLIILGENKNQISILYNLMRAMIISYQRHFELEGLSNFKIGGQDIKLFVPIPDRVFSRAITMNFEYEIVTPDIDIQRIFSKFRLFYKPEGATTAQGPIPIELQEDDQSI